MNQNKATDFDVFIIGAGPAGSSTALSFLKNSNKLRVGLADKAVFPRDKACGDGLGPGVVSSLKSLALNYEDIPNIHTVSKAEVHGLDGLAFCAGLEGAEFDFPHGLVVKRLELDNFLYQAALERGAEIFSKTRFINYELDSNLVTVTLKDLTTEQEFTKTCKLLVGSDGASSRVRNGAGIPPNSSKHTGIAIRAYANIPNEWSDRIIISYGSDLRPGYGWCFPLGNGLANVGFGLVVKDFQRRKPDLKELLNDYIIALENRGLPCSGLHDFSTHILPGGVLPKLTSDRVALVGDAGSMINPLSGEGIVYGMHAASILADTVYLALENNSDIDSSLVKYEQEFKKEYKSHFRSCLIANRLLRSKIWTRLILGAASVDLRTRLAGIKLMFGKGKMTAGIAIRAFWYGKGFVRGKAR